MIVECIKNDVSQMLYVINDAALKYKGIIPEDCWHDPYMLEVELLKNMQNGVRMFGYKSNNKLLGVMGIQEVKDFKLIRHAYILTQYQGVGIGKKLLEYLLIGNHSSCFLVGTWKNAYWAIKFYEKFDFVIQTKKETIQLLNKYWEITSNQIKNSVVLRR